MVFYWVISFQRQHLTIFRYGLLNRQKIWPENVEEQLRIGENLVFFPSKVSPNNSISNDVEDSGAPLGIFVVIVIWLKPEIKGGRGKKETKTKITWRKKNLI